MRKSLFLGAGASTPYGMPTTGEFMTLLRNEGRDRHRWQEVAATLGALSIERLFDGLADTGRYFSTDAGRSVRSLLESAMGGRARWMRDVPKLEADLRARIFEAYRWNPRNRALLGAVLGPLLDLAAEQDEVPVYTTNYDRCVEEYCSDSRRSLLCNDGFREDALAGRFRWSNTYGRTRAAERAGAQRMLNLHKLHGSLGWKLGPYGPERIAYESLSDSAHYEDLLIYPSSRPDPLMETALFRTIFSEFRGNLLSSDMCIVVGYSFRDPDIAGVFRDFVRGGRTLVVVGDKAVPDLCNSVLRPAVAAGVAGSRRRAGPGRIARIVPSLPNVYAVSELMGPETIPRITRDINRLCQARPIVP